MKRETLEIPIEHRSVETVSALWDEPERRDARGLGVLLAHGAGADLDSPFLVHVAEGLAARGLPVLRFRYPYMERIAREGARRAPDRAPVLEAAHERALAVLRERLPDGRLLLAGKSLGGRMSTHLAAKGADCAGLVLLGYPLHPPKRPEKERSEHFPAIAQPALFLQGTRDDLAELPRLERALRHFGGVATLRVVDDGNHSFEVRKSSGRTTREAWDQLLDETWSWLGATWPP